jgi:hypothetical protein
MLAANKKAAPGMGLPEAAYAGLSPRWSRYLARRLKGQGAGQRCWPLIFVPARKLTCRAEASPDSCPVSLLDAP